MLRTGIAVFALPRSVLSVLGRPPAIIVSEAASFLYPLLALSVVLVLLGVYLIVHASLQIRRYDRQISKILEKHAAVAEFID